MQLVSEAKRDRLSAWKHKVARRINWPLTKKILTGLFFMLVVYLLVTRAATIDWSQVFTTFRQTPMSSLAIGFAVGLVSYAFYGSYDLIGRYLLKIKVSAFPTWLAGCISFACNLNLGAIVGSVAFRYRLYSRLGVAAGDVTQILGISVTTNWLTYIMLAGGLFVSGAISPPDSWFINKLVLQLLGGVFLLIVASYVYASAFASKREYHFGSHTVAVPSFKVAVVQLLLASCHWTLMALVMYQFFPSEIGFFTIFAVLLVSCIAGALAHIPGGLGVLEAVFIVFLSGQMQNYQIIAALFAYRCVFYFGPLALTLPLYLAFEAYYGRKRHIQNKAAQNAPSNEAAAP